MAHSIEECGICAFSYDKRSHKKVSCPHELCKNEMCLTCFETVLLDSGLSPQCMWCKKDIFFSFIVKHVSAKTLKKYMDKRGDLFLERAKSYLPFLQNQADDILRGQRVLKRIELHGEELRGITFQNSKIKIELDEKYKIIGISSRSTFTVKSSIFYAEKNIHWSLQRLYEYNKSLCDGCDGNVNYRCRDCPVKLCSSCARLILICNDRKCFSCAKALSLDEIKNNFGVSYYDKFFKPKTPKHLKYSELKEEVLEKINEKIALFNRFMEICVDVEHVRSEGLEMPEYDTGSHVEKPKPKKDFIKKCPDSDCRGFLSTAWKCGLCHSNFCVECHGKKHEGEKHECDEDEKATIKILKEESKPCPGCQMPISRIDGCSQVWTPCCKIAFDWNTGKIDNGRIHSPEYFAYMRRTLGAVPREKDDHCGENMYLGTLYNRLGVTNIQKFNIDIFWQLKEHVDWLSRNLPLESDAPLTHDDLGVRYLLSEISEKDWKSTLSRREKKREKDIKIHDILTTFTVVMNDLSLDMVYGTNSVEEKCEDFCEKVRRLIEYTNLEIKKINDVFGSKEKKYFLNLRQ